MKRAWLRELVLFSVVALVTWWFRHIIKGTPATTVIGAPCIAEARDPGIPENLDNSGLRAWLAEALADADSPRIAGIAKSLAPDSEARIWRAVFVRWFHEAPAEAWRFALGRSGTNDSTRLCLLALETWATTDPTAARAALASPTEEQFKALVRGAKEKDIEAAFRILDEALASGVALDASTIQAPDNFNLDDEEFVELATIHPEAAWHWAGRISTERFLGPVLLGWMDKDASAASAWVGQRPDRNEVLLNALGLMRNHEMSYQPGTMEALLALTPPGNLKSEYVSDAMEQLARSNPDLAVNETLRLLSDPENQAEVIGRIAGIVARSDFTKAWEVLSLLDDSVTGIRRVNLPKIEASAPSQNENPGTPHSYGWGLTSMRGLVSPADAKSEILVRLIEVDKEQALRLMERTSVRSFLELGESCMELWTDRDPAEALTWLARKLGGQGEIDEIREWIPYSNIDDESLRDLADQLPEGTVRASLDSLLAERLADKAPAQAIDFAREHHLRTETTIDIYLQWASKEPKSALQHLAANPDGSPGAWNAVVHEVIGKIPEETAQAVNQLPDGPARDDASAGVARFLSEDHDPLSAVEWATAIQGERQRGETLKALMDSVSMDLRFLNDRESVEALREAISSTDNIPDAEKARWLGDLESYLIEP